MKSRELFGSMQCLKCYIPSSLEGHVVTSQASIDKQTKLSKPEESTSQSTLSILLLGRRVSKSVDDSAKRPDKTKSRAEQRVTKATDEQCCKGQVVVLEVVAVGALYCFKSEIADMICLGSNVPEHS